MLARRGDQHRSANHAGVEPLQAAFGALVKVHIQVNEGKPQMFQTCSTFRE